MSDIEISWDLIKETLGDDLADCITEGIGPDGCESENWEIEWNSFCSSLIDFIAVENDQKIGELVRKQVGGYLVGVALKKINFRRNIEIELDDFQEALRKDALFCKQLKVEAA